MTLTERQLIDADESLSEWHKNLVPMDSVEKWLKYFREELPAVAFKCSTHHQKSNLEKKYTAKGAKTSPKPSRLLAAADCLGAQTLIKLLKKYSKRNEITNTITVGVVGLLNVGKSSIINSLKRCHVVYVSATPGLTRSMQEVELDKNVKLVDCPGVVMVKSKENEASIALGKCIIIDKVDDPTSPVHHLPRPRSSTHILLLTATRDGSFGSGTEEKIIVKTSS